MIENRFTTTKYAYNICQIYRNKNLLKTKSDDVSNVVAGSISAL